MAEQGLFSAELLSPEVQSALPEGYQLRALRRGDYDTGFLDCLRVLTTVGEVSKEQFEDRYDWVSRQDGGYFILVIEDTNSSPARVVGTGGLLVERKLYVVSRPHGPNNNNHDHV
jgi:glucosamine-phosphate N-acetyltransferase